MEFIQSIRSEHVHQDSREHMETAVRLYENREYGSVAVPCRTALQEALRHYGVKDGPITRMIEAAIEEGLVKGFVSHGCETIATAGGAAAHSSDGPASRDEALAIIGMAAIALGRLYALPR